MDMMTEQDIQPQQDIDGEYPLDTLAFLQTVIGSPNLVDMLDDTTLTEVSQAVIERYEIDKGTMSEWHTTMEKAIDMVKMAKHDKTYPFDNASNVKYPLIVSAALQYNARAYPATKRASASASFCGATNLCPFKYTFSIFFLLGLLHHYPAATG